MKIFDNTFNAIEKALDQRFRRHVVLSGNVANASTPKYKARDVNFGDELERLGGRSQSDLAKTNKSHMDVGGSSAPHIVLDNSGAIGADGNNVDLDIAMGKISGNSRAYTGAATYFSMKLRLIRYAAMGGRGGV